MALLVDGVFDNSLNLRLFRLVYLVHFDLRVGRTDWFHDVFDLIRCAKRLRVHGGRSRGGHAAPQFKKYRNAGIVAVVLLVIAFVGHWELKIPAEFRIIAQNETTVRAQTEGVIVEMMVREGTAVRKGDVLGAASRFRKAAAD